MKLRRLFPFILALAVVLTAALPMTAFAAPLAKDGTITISPPATQVLVPGDFAAYQLFEVTAITLVQGKYQFSYTPLAPVEDFLKWLDTKGYDLTDYDVDSDPNGTPDELAAACDEFRIWLQDNYEQTYDHADVIDLAQLMYISGALGTAKPGMDAAPDVKFSGLDYGYYLVVGSAKFSNVADGTSADHSAPVFSRAMLINVPELTYEAGHLYDPAHITGWTPHAKRNLKADAPFVKKDVWFPGAGPNGVTVPAATDTGWQTWSDASIGDTVYFKVTSRVPDLTGYSSYFFEMTDILSDGLTFNTVGDDFSTTDVIMTIGGTGYTEFTADLSGQVLIISIPYERLKAAAKDAPIVITYAATLNSGADIAGDGNSNEVQLEYRNNPNWVNDGTKGPTSKTPKDRVRVYTYKLDILKYTGALQIVACNSGHGDSGPCPECNDTGKKVVGYTPLANAKFILCRDEAGTLPLFFTNNSNGNYTVKKTGSASDTIIVSPDSGMINIKGLAAGTYWLIETAAPLGFNINPDPVEIVITKGAIDSTSKEVGYTINTHSPVNTGDIPADVNIENNTGGILPGTGGAGIYIILAIGGIMAILLTFAYLAYRKKKKQNTLYATN